MEQQQQQIPARTSHSGGNELGPGLLIVVAIIALVFLISAAIHVLLRFLSQKPSQTSTGADSPIFLPTTSPPSPSRENGYNELIESLPLFSLASALSSAPKSSPDCAVCLSRFDPQDQLRLLPSCRHAFHATCIDTWLKSNLSCPLCRASVVLTAPTTNPPINHSGSFRVEIGSISRRRDPSEDSRSYSLGSSFHYIVEEEVDAVVNSIAANIREQRWKERIKNLNRLAPGENVAEVAGGSRNWLVDYMERLAHSASSSFSSLRFAGCGSRRVTGDLDGRQQAQQEDEYGESVNSFYRWLVGA